MERILSDPFRAGGNPPCVYKRSCRCRCDFLLPESLLALQQDSTHSAEDVISILLPREMLAMFYSRSHIPLPLSIMPTCMLTHFQGNTGPRKLMRWVITEGNNSIRTDLGLLRSNIVRNMVHMINVMFYLATRLMRHFFAAEYMPILREVEKILVRGWIRWGRNEERSYCRTGCWQQADSKPLLAFRSFTVAYWPECKDEWWYT